MSFIVLFLSFSSLQRLFFHDVFDEVLNNRHHLEKYLNYAESEVRNLDKLARIIDYLIVAFNTKNENFIGAQKLLDKFERVL